MCVFLLTWYFSPHVGCVCQANSRTILSFFQIILRTIARTATRIVSVPTVGRPCEDYYPTRRNRCQNSAGISASHSASFNFMIHTKVSLLCMYSSELAF